MEEVEGELNLFDHFLFVAAEVAGEAMPQQLPQQRRKKRKRKKKWTWVAVWICSEATKVAVVVAITRTCQPIKRTYIIIMGIHTKHSKIASRKLSVVNTINIKR